MSIQDDINAGLSLLPMKMRSESARVILHAINLQENPRRLEQQIGGPARGDYQFESGGGVKGVLSHAASKDLAYSVCAARGVKADRLSVYEAIGHDPILAAALARLLLWTDPKPMPAVGDEPGAWSLYLRVWRPGAYERQPEELRAKFKKNYATAMAARA